MTLEFAPEARAEAAAAASYYEEIESGLGTRFILEVERIVQAVLAQPTLWRRRSGGYRRTNLTGFPYYMAYVERGERIIVVALGHGARLPGYFRERLRERPDC